jgi:hypothetical protein
MTPEEKLELAELLEYRTRSSFEIRRERCIAAEMRLGMWEGGRFVGHGLAELVEKARCGRPLTRDEWIVMHAGFSNPELSHGRPNANGAVESSHAANLSSMLESTQSRN